MNVIKFLVLFTTTFIFSQVKNEDVYFLINQNHFEYVIIPQGGNFTNTTMSKTIKKFKLYDREEFEKLENLKKYDKKNGTYKRFQFRPKESVFNVSKKSKNKTVDHCNIKKLNIINYEWLIKNSWKENNPNVLFRDLYFLYKLDNNKFIRYKVNRSVIAY